MSRRRALADDPTRFDWLGLLREMERGTPDKPRIGKSPVMRDDVVRLQQLPYMEFPRVNIQSVEFEPGETPRISAAFLGYFGPQGPLPLMMTDEVKRWNDNGDPAFVEFANLFATRFLQLFYRAWADARPIAQADRPDDDRFVDYIGAFIGIGSAAARGRDRIPDQAKLGFAGLFNSRVKSPGRLAQIIRGVLHVDVSIREREAMWLEFEPGDLTRLGQAGASLGRNSHAGARVQSINDKAVIEIRTASLDDYRRFLPGAEGFDRLADLVALFLGTQMEFDVELALPAESRPAAQLGATAQLGWTTWVAPKPPEPEAPKFVSDARFSLNRAVQTA